MLNKAAKLLSWALHPSIVPVYVMMILLFTNTIHSYHTIRVKFYLLWSVALYTLVLPALTFALVKHLRRKRWQSLSRRHLVIITLLVGAVCYMLLAMTMAGVPSLALFRKGAMVGVMCSLFCLVTMPICRVSLHLTAMGAVVALFVMLNILGETSLFAELLSSILLSGMLASARLYMGRNRGRQLLVGFVGGFLLSVAAMLWI